MTIFDILNLIGNIHRGNSEGEIRTRKLLIIAENIARKMSAELLKHGIMIDYKGKIEKENG